MDSQSSIEGISNDLTPHVDRPEWTLSSYGPAKGQPTLIGGLDQSPEEMRVKAVEAVKSTSIQQYIAYETAQFTAAQNKLNDAKANLQSVFDHARRNEQNPHSASPYVFGAPVFGSGTSTFGSTANSSAFGKPTGFGAFASSSSAFSAPSTNPQGSAFGKSTFGQPPQSTPSVFGAAVQPGQVFGQTTQTPSAFGQPQQVQAFSAFAKPPQSPSVFGQRTQQVSAFGQTPQPTSAFGQPAQQTSAFGQSSQPPSTFGSNPPPPSAFGQTPQPVSAFGQPAFAQPSQTRSPMLKPASGAFGSTAGGAFSSNPTGSGGFSAFSGQPSAFGLGAAGNVAAVSAFGQSSFGGNSTVTGGSTPTFGAPTGFGTQPTLMNNFGTSASAPVSAFAQTGSAFGSTNSPRSAFSSAPAQSQSSFQPSGTNVFPLSSAPPNPQPAPPQPKPKSTKPDFANFKAKYQPGINKYDDLLPPNYLELLPKAAREAFERPVFEWGKIPEWIPPKELR